MSARPRRVLVTGSRDWTDEAIVASALHAVRSTWTNAHLTLVHGGCSTGADAIADRLWREAQMGPVEIHEAEWGKYGRRAGPARNEAMVKAGADVCLAFLGPCTKASCPDREPHASHGARGCSELAAAAEISVVRLTPQGVVW